jgi:ribosomal protein S18 acetylase RimI-like enzyme
MGVAIRQLVSADRESVCDILRRCDAFTAAEVSGALELVDDAIRTGLNGDYIAFVAVCDSDVCGYVCIGRTPFTASTWHLYWICVDSGRQGRGVGRALQSHAEIFARSLGGERLVVETSSQTSYDRARRFYDARGYRAVGRIPNFYKLNDDCILYCIELTR